MFALQSGGTNEVRRLIKNRHPQGMFYVVLVFCISVLIGAFPVSGVLADAEIDLPVVEVLESGNSGLDQPEPDEQIDDKLSLGMVSVATDFRRVNWTCPTAVAFRPLFGSGVFVLPPTTAPPVSLA